MNTNDKLRLGATAAALVLLTIASSARLQAWGGQGHRLVALLAAERLTPVARRNVVWLLGPESLADVASWADRYHDGAYQTFYWHFVNIPPERYQQVNGNPPPDETTMATGDAGKRVACGVIGTG